MKKTTVLASLLFSLVGLLACSVFSPSSEPTSLPAEASATNIAAPASTLTPTPTFTPEPTATPLGYYLNEPAKFALILPDTWEVLEEYGGSGTYFGLKNDFVLYLSITDVDENASLDAWMQEVEAELAVSFNVINIDQVELANTITAERAEVQFDYMEDGDTIVMMHVGVHPSHRSQGVAGKVTQVALEYAKEKSLRVIPMCSYVGAYIRRHPEYIGLTKQHTVE